MVYLPIEPTWLRRVLAIGVLYAALLTTAASFVLLRRPEVLRDSRRRAALKVYYGARIFGVVLMAVLLWRLVIPFAADIVALSRNDGPDRLAAEVTGIEMPAVRFALFYRRVWLADDRRAYSLYFYFGQLSRGEIRTFTVLSRSRMIVDFK